MINDKHYFHYKTCVLMKNKTFNLKKDMFRQLRMLCHHQFVDGITMMYNIRRVSIDSLFYHRDGRHCNTRRFAHALTPKPQPTVLPLPDSLLKRFSIARTPEFRLADRLYQLQVWYCVESIFVLDTEAARGRRQLHVFALNH